MQHTIHLSSTRAVRFLFGMLALILALHLSVAFSHVVLHLPVAAFTVLCDMDLEANLPAIFNVLLFLVGALLFYAMGRQEEGKARRPWMLLALVFTFLAFDEGAQIHEKLMLPMLRLMNDGGLGNGEMGILYYAWIIPYGLAALALLAILLPWLVKLDGRTRNGLFFSGALYVFGAIFLESASGQVAEGSVIPPIEELAWLPCFAYPEHTCYQYDNIAYIALYTLEEVAEMSGLILCIGVLLRAMERRGTELRLRFGKD